MAPASPRSMWHHVPMPGSATDLVLVAVMIVALSGSPARAQPSQSASARGVDVPLAIVGAWVITGVGPTPLRDAVVVMAGERFACVGTRAECPIPSNARTVEASGQWLMPGLIDTHVHLWWDSAGTAIAQQWRLAHGITSVREMGTNGELHANLDARRVARSGRVATPRLFVSGRMPHGGGDLAVALERTDRLIAAGVDGIKIKDSVSIDALRAVLARAYLSGIPVYGHLSGIVGDSLPLFLTAIDAGLDGVVHLSDALGYLLRSDPHDLPPPTGHGGDLVARRLFFRAVWARVDPAKRDIVIAAMVKAGVWLEPTLLSEEWALVPRTAADGPGPELALPPANPDVGVPGRGRRGPLPDPDPGTEAGRARLAMEDFVFRFVAAGGRVVTGSDNEAEPGFEIHRELALLQAAGLPPERALRAATLDAARAIGVADELGSIEPGKLADAVLLRKNPLDDIHHVSEVSLVIKGGHVYAADAIAAAADSAAGALAVARVDDRPEAIGPRRALLLVTLVSLCALATPLVVGKR